MREPGCGKGLERSRCAAGHGRCIQKAKAGNAEHAPIMDGSRSRSDVIIPHPLTLTLTARHYVYCEHLNLNALYGVTNLDSRTKGGNH